MKTRHAKSSCCDASVFRFGKRRRQCSHCQRTWSVWKQKRGRPAIRVHSSLRAIAFPSHESLRYRATRLGKGREWVRRRHSVQLSYLLRTLPLSPVPAGALIAIVDGYQLFFAGHPWTVYILLLRPIGGSRATVMEPYMKVGPETVRGWEQAFAQLLATALHRIRAVVADGMLGLDRMAQAHQWILQRCHVHLIRILYPLLGNRFKSVTRKRLRRLAYHHVLTVLTSADDTVIRQSLAKLRSYAYAPDFPRRFGLKLRGFLHRYQEFRSYRTYPKLHLPNTTNTAEMVCGKIAEVVRRTRGFRTPRSFERWVRLLIRAQSTVQCREATINRKTMSYSFKNMVTDERGNQYQPTSYRLGFNSTRFDW